MKKYIYCYKGTSSTNTSTENDIPGNILINLSDLLMYIYMEHNICGTYIRRNKQDYSLYSYIFVYTCICTIITVGSNHIHK